MQIENFIIKKKIMYWVRKLSNASLSIKKDKNQQKEIGLYYKKLAMKSIDPSHSAHRAKPTA